MNQPPYLQQIFDRLKRGYHLGPDDEPEFSSLVTLYDDYVAWFEPLGMKLIRHEREFFYFAPDNPEVVSETLPRIAVFSYILIDHAANQGRSIEDFIFGRNFLLSTLPHFELDRYKDFLRQVNIHEIDDLRNVLKHMERIGWVKWLSHEELRFLRPFHRMFSKCLELSQSNDSPPHKGDSDDSPSTTMDPQRPTTQCPPDQSA